jgi:hypothetical protein
VGANLWLCGIGGAHARGERHRQTRVAELLRRHLPAAVFAAALDNAPRTALAGLLAKQPGTRSPVKRLARACASSGPEEARVLVTSSGGFVQRRVFYLSDGPFLPFPASGGRGCCGIRWENRHRGGGH